MDEVKFTIIGAGVVGLAIADTLSVEYDGIVVAEKHGAIGQETSSRNSEVIHSGIYYPENSLKAKLCVEGATQLYDLSAKYAIPHRKIGKLIVATENHEEETIEKLYEKGKRNTVEHLKILDKTDVQKMEPNVNAVSALYSADTGIISSHALMKHFYNKALSQGVVFSFNTEVNMLRRENDFFIVGIKGEDYRFKSKVVINCGGLSSNAVAQCAHIDINKWGYKLHFCKGSYFSYAEASPIKMLVYPVPHENLAGLGVHATLDLGGRLRFGPDVEYIELPDYKVNPDKRNLFYTCAVKIINGLKEEAFVADMAGVRPKLNGPNEKVRDFIIREESDKDLPGLINLIGIESPGLTASPAIADMVVSIVKKLL